MKRRQFIVGGLALGGAGVLGMLAGCEGESQPQAQPRAAAQAPTVDPFEQGVRRHLPTLQISRGEIRRFERAYEAQHGPARPEPDDPMLATLFLLSSDFFRNGEDETRPVRFQALYDPYANPCYDPMAGAEERPASPGGAA